MASAVFGAKLRTWMSKMRGSSNGNNNCSPSRDSQPFDFHSPCSPVSGPSSLPFFGRSYYPNADISCPKLPKNKRGSKRRKLNCMTVSNSQSFDRIRQQMYEEEYGFQLESPNGNTNPNVGRLVATGSATAPWDPRVQPCRSQNGQTPLRGNITDNRMFQAPRSVSLSSPESAYGSGNSEDSLTPASSTHPDLHHFPMGRHHWLMSSGQSYSSLRQHSNSSVASCTPCVANGNGNGSTRSVDRPKIKTNPWVTFQRNLEQELPQNNLVSPKSDEVKQGPMVSRTKSLSLRDKPNSQAKRAQSFRSPLFGANKSSLNKISSESESDWDEDQDDKDVEMAIDKDDDTRIEASSSIGAVCGSSKLRSLTATSSPMKSLTFAGEKGLIAQMRYHPKMMAQVRGDTKKAGVTGKNVNCPNCFLMSRHHLGSRRNKCQPTRPPLDSQLCAYCRSWVLAEEDSTTDVDTDSDFNETSSSSSSCSSPVGAGRQKKRLPLSSYYSNFGAAARRRRWRKTLPQKTVSRELSTSCSSFLFEGDFGQGNKSNSRAGRQMTPSSDSDDLSPPSSGNGNRSARLMPSTPTVASRVEQTSVSAMSTPLRHTNPFWKHLETEETVVPENTETGDVTMSADDPMGYKTLLSSMEALMAKFGELASSPSRKMHATPRPRSSDTILESFGSDFPWCTSTPREPSLSQPEPSANILNMGFSSRSSLGLTANGSSCDTLTELPPLSNNGATFAKRPSQSANPSQKMFNEADWMNGNSAVRELSPLKDLCSPMSSVETGSVSSYTRRPGIRSRYAEEPLVKCRVEEEVDDPLESLHLHLHHNPLVSHLGEDTVGGSSGDRRSFNSLEEKLKKLRQERMLLEAKIREARDEDKKKRKAKVSL